MLCLIFLIIKIKHKKTPFLSPLTTGQNVRPPNVQINNHSEYSFAPFSFNLTDNLSPLLKKENETKNKKNKVMQPNRIAEPMSHF